MAFDPESYERDVVRPLRNRRGAVPVPPVLYAVDPGMDRTAIEAHLRRLRAYWGQKARTGTSIGMACKQLIAADEELRGRPGVDLTDPVWWKQQFEQRGVEERAARQKLIVALQEAFGSAGQITRAQLETVARHYGGVGVAQAERAAGDAGLDVIDSLDLPADCGLSHTQYVQLRDRLAEAGARTVVHLLHPDVTTSFSIARGFAVAGRPELRLDREQLERLVARAESAADSTGARARKAALALLRSAYTKVPDLAAITLYHIVDQVQESQWAGMPPAMLAAQIVDLGVTREDAGLIAVSLPRETGGGATVRGLDRIQQLIEAHQLGEARAALAALPAEHPEHAAATALFTRAESTFDGYLAQATEAERRHDVARAMTLLRQAAELDADNPTVTAMIDRLPAPGPVQLTLAEHTSPPGIRLAWTAGPGAAGTLTYRVVRSDERAPVNETDGVQIAQSGDRQTVDTGVTPGRPAFYAVFASTNGTVWSRPATGAVTALPQVGDVVLDADADRVVGSWRAHPAAVRVRVRRSVGPLPSGFRDGAPVTVTGHSFRDTPVRVGEPHHYEFTAVYHDAAGREVTARPVVASAVPRGVAGSVDDLMVEPVTTADGSTRVRLTWSAGRHDDVEIRRADRAPDWSPGERISAERARGFGIALPGDASVTGHRAALECAVPAGRHVYVPFAFGAGGAVVGVAVTMGVTTPVTAPQVRRTGDRLIVTWHWPDGVGLAEVRWDAPGGGTSVISRARYDAEGGCVLAATPRGGTVEIRTLAVGPTGTSRSPAVRLTVGPRAARVAYTITRPTPPDGRPLLARLRDRVRDRQRVVELTSEQECGGLEVVIVVAGGVVMPVRPTQGTELARETGVRIRPGVPHAIDVQVPASVNRPYWIRCFVSASTGCAVTDPPIDQMKVS